MPVILARSIRKLQTVVNFDSRGPDPVKVVDFKLKDWQIML